MRSVSPAPAAIRIKDGTLGAAALKTLRGQIFIKINPHWEIHQEIQLLERTQGYSKPK